MSDDCFCSNKSVLISETAVISCGDCRDHHSTNGFGSISLLPGVELGGLPVLIHTQISSLQYTTQKSANISPTWCFFIHNCTSTFTPGKVLAPLMLAESEEIGIGSNQRPPHSVPATPTSVMFKTIKTYQKEQKWIKINEKHEKSIENYQNG